MRFVSLVSLVSCSLFVLSGCASQQYLSHSNQSDPVKELSAQTMSESQSIDALIAMSSTGRLFAGVDHWMIGRIQAQFQNVSETTLMPIFESAIENFSPDNLTDGVKVSVAQHYHSQYMAQLLKWYSSDIGKAYSQRSIHVDTQSAEFVAWFETADFDTENAVLVRQLMEVSQALEMVETRMLVPHQGMSIGLQQASRRAGLNGSMYVDSSITTQITKAQNVAVMCAMFAYRDLSTRQLQNIIAFEQSRAARWYYGAIHSGMQQALFQASRRLSEGMTRSVMLRVSKELSKT